MLLVWWVFLYAFMVFPDEYVMLNVAVYSPHYDLLYLVENLALLAVLGMLAWNTRGAWKQIYWNFFVASGLYAISSLALNMAIARGQYHTGSLYDIPFIASVCWMIWATLLARELKPPSSRRRRALALADAGAPAGHAGDAFSAGDGILGMVSRHGAASPAPVPVAGYAGGDAGAGPVRLSSSSF